MQELPVPPGTIVVGVDASPAADDALDWAIREARTEGLPLTLVHGVGPSISAWVEVEELDLRHVFDTLSSSGQEILDRARSEVRRQAPEVVVYEVLRLSGPHHALMALAPEAAMIVVGSRSASAHQGPLLSSAVGFVAAHASCPVVVPRPHGPGADIGVVVVCDGSAESTGPLAYAWGQADRRGVPLTVLHCLPDPPGTGEITDIGLMDATAGMDADLGPSMLGFERMLLADLVNDLKGRWPGVDVSLVTEHGAVEDSLARAAAQADMLVLGAHHARRVSETVIGSSAPADVQCVTVVLPQEDRVEVDVDAMLASLGLEASSAFDPAESAVPQPVRRSQPLSERVPAYVPVLRKRRTLPGS